MPEYFNNRTFIESIPGNGNHSHNSGSNTILYVFLGIGAIAILGYFIQREKNKKNMAIILKENDDLKNRKT